MIGKAGLFILLSILLVACFAVPLGELIWFAIHSDLFSYILLIPFVSLYLGWIYCKSKSATSRPAKKILSLAPMLVGAALLWACYGDSTLFGKHSPDVLTWRTASFVLFFYAICLFCLRWDVVKALMFPLALLVFMIPFPRFMILAIETCLQHASAATAQVLFELTGLPSLREGLTFQLPGIHLQVAPECSGIHSTLVLFITSLVAGRLFIRGLGKRAMFTTLVLPLGILRNAFRILVIGQLCVRVGPHMIDSPIHHRGGPLFFAMSLLPLFLLLYYFRKSEESQNAGPLPQPST